MSDSDSASSDTDADNVAADTMTAGPSPRWWRNRRRWFYLIVTAATVALLWGGWSWWYRAGFPMPAIGWLEKVGIDSDPVRRELGKARIAMLTWKVERETRRLRLEGTIWKSVFGTGMATLEFGRDGCIRLRPNTALTDMIDNGYSTDFELQLSERLALARFDGTAYRFDGMAYRTPPERPDLEGLWPESPNLDVEDSPWDIRGYYDGSELCLHFRVRHPSESFPERGWIVHLWKVEADAGSPR